MKFVIQCIYFFFSVSLIAQSNEKVFKLKFEDLTFIDKSNYQTLILTDQRIEKEFLGFVQTGMFNASARVVTEEPLGKQFAKFIPYITSKITSDDTIILQLNHLNFAEVTGAFSENGYINLLANLYAKKNNQCYKLAHIDSTFNVKGLDVTNKTLNEGSKQLLTLIRDNLKTEIDESLPSLEYGYLINMDSIEKSQLPLYKNLEYVDGGYLTFESFKNQVPDVKIIVEFDKKGKIDKVTKLPVVLRENFHEYYAVVHDGKPYISTDKGYVQLYKNKGVIYFIGKLKDANKQSSASMAAGLGFGLIGGLLVHSLAGEATSNFMIVLDHRNGNILPIRRIK